MPPRYSVLLPTHNRRDVVGYAISSVLNQTEADFELLVVGDGCTDGTADVVASFRDPRIRWFDLPKAPHFGYANRNIALREARGELVGFMAHDDLLFPDHLELLGAALADDSLELAYSRPLWIADDGRIVPFAIDLRVPDQLEIFLTHHNSIPASCVAYRRSCHKRIGYWPEDNVGGGGDWALWQRIIGPSRGANLAYVPSATALHFRADWRTGATWGPDPLPAWLDVAATDVWPTALRVHMATGSTPQAVVWERISHDEASLSASVRSGIREGIDLLAWTSAARLAEADVERAELQRRLADAELQEGRLRADLLTATADAEWARAEAERSAMRARAAEANQKASSLVRRSARRLHMALGENPLFDPAWYSAHYRDVTVREARRHWRTQGAKALRDPNSWFSTRAYLERYPDVRSSRMNPLDHYYVYGTLEGRSPAADEQITN